MKTLTKPLSKKELELLDLVMTGEASRICGVDRRTFQKRVDNDEIKAVAVSEGRQLFHRKDVIELAKRMKQEKPDSKDK